MPKGVYSQILPYDELPEYGEKLFFDLWELEAHSRAKLFLAGLKQTPYKNILIVSHAGFLNRFLYAVLENGAKKGNEPPPSPNDLYFGVNNCGISSLILYDQEKTLSDVVLFWNNTSHLAGLHRSEQED
jgi:broad specificity phosphatase PhoE